MEKVVENKKSKIVLIVLILLAMLSSYVPKITYAGKIENEYVKFKTNWTNTTNEFDITSDKTAYVLFDLQLSGGVVTGFRNMKIKAENYNETSEDASKPIANIKINPVANSSEIINGSTSSTVEFDSPLNAGTAISGDIAVNVDTRTYASFEPFARKIKITLSGEYQDPITRETKYIENIIQPKILTLNVTPEEKVTDLYSYIAINEKGTGAKVLAPHITIDNSYANAEHTGATCGWYAGEIQGNYTIRVNTTEYIQKQTLVVTINRINTALEEKPSKLDVGYTVDWGNLKTDFGEPVKTTNEAGADVYTFNKGTDSDTFNKDNTFSIPNKVYSVYVHYNTENSVGHFENEKMTCAILQVDSTVIGWKETENAEGLSTEKNTIKTSKINNEDLGLSGYTPGAHSWMSIQYIPGSGGGVTLEEKQKFIEDGTIDLTFKSEGKYVLGSQNTVESGTIKYNKPVLEYYSDDKTIKTMELDSDTMRLKSLEAKQLSLDRTLDIVSDSEDLWKGKSGEKYIVPNGKNINAMSVKVNDFIALTGEGENKIWSFGPYNYGESELLNTVNLLPALGTHVYEETYTLSLQKLKDAGLTDTEINNIISVSISTKTTDAWLYASNTARYLFGDSEALKKSYLEMDIKGYDCEAKKDSKTIKLSMYKNSDVILNNNISVKNVNPKIYVKLTTGFDYTITNIAMTPNPDIAIKNSNIEIINGERYICIECEGTYDSTKLGKIDIKIDLNRRLQDTTLDKRQSITAYMLTDNENYFVQTGNIYEFSKNNSIPNTLYATTQSYNIANTDSVEIATGVYNTSGKLIEGDSSSIKGTKEEPIKFPKNSKVKYYTKIMNNSDSLKNISIINRLPTIGNKSITNTELNLESTINLINLENIKVYTKKVRTEKQELNSTQYTIGYSNNAQENENMTFDSSYAGYTNGIADVKTIQIKLAEDYQLPSGTVLMVEYEMTMPDATGMAGETTAVSYIKNAAAETTILESAPIYVGVGNSYGTVNVQKVYQFFPVGTAPEGKSLENIELRLVNVVTGQPLVTSETTSQGIIRTNSTGLAVFKYVPSGVEYKVEEVTNIPGYNRIDNYSTVMLENGETVDFTVTNGGISKLTLEKKWEDTNDQQGSVVLMIKSKQTGNTYQVSQKTDPETGLAQITGIPYGTYEVTETKGVYGWYLTPTEIVVDEPEETKEIENKIGRATLVIKKTVPIGDSVQGLKFNITGTGYIRYTNKSGVLKQTDYSNVITIGDDYTSNPDINIEILDDNKTAIITLSNLYLGDYVVEETDMPKVGDKDRYVPIYRTVSLKENGETKNLNLTNQWKHGYLQIEKTARLKLTDGSYQDIGELNQFKVRVTGTSEYGTEVDETIELNEDGKSDLTAIEIGEYTITEVPADGYTPYYTVNQSGADVQTIVPPTVKIEYGQTTTQKIYNEHTGVGYVKVVKTLEGVTNPQKVVDAGIKFKVVGKNVAGGQVEEVINIDQIDLENDIAYGVSGPISVGGDYQLEEIEATVPNYFEGIEPRKVDLTTASTITNPLVIDVENKKTKGNLEITTETIPAGGPLTGITYKVTEVEIKKDGTYEKVGEPVELIGSNLSSNASFAELKQIRSGNYLVEQLTVPDGWVKDLNQIVEVPSYTTGYAVFEITQEQEQVNTKVIVNKEIVNQNGEVATQADFDNAKLNKDESFEVKITNVDTKQEYYTFISGAQKGTITGLMPGTYEIEEAYKPKYETAGYYKLEGGIAPIAMEKNLEGKYEFTILDNTSKVEMTIKNSINTGFTFGGQSMIDNYSKYNTDAQEEMNAMTKSIIYIVDENGEAMPGAKFKLLDNNGNVVVLGSAGTELTTVNRKLVLNGLPAGNYTLSNISVPDGYLQPADKSIQVFDKATRIARIEIQKNIPRGSVSLSTTYVNKYGETKYVPRSKYKVVNPSTGEVLKFNKTLTGDYIKSELEDASAEISLKSGVVEVTGIEVGTYEFGLTGVTDGYGMQNNLPETVAIQENEIKNVNVEVISQKIKQISAGYDNTMYLDENGDLWVLGENSNNMYGSPLETRSTISHKIQFPEEVKIEKYAQTEGFVVAIDLEGKVWTWGRTTGVFGCIDKFQNIQTPYCISTENANPIKEAFNNGIKIVDIYATYYGVIAKDNEGRIWVWGNLLNNYEGRKLPRCISTDEENEIGKAFKKGIKIDKIFSETGNYYSSKLQCLDSVGRLWQIDKEIVNLTEKYQELRTIKIIDSCIGYIVDDSGNIWELGSTKITKKYDTTNFGGAKIIKIRGDLNRFIMLDENGKVWRGNQCISNELNIKVKDIAYETSNETILVLGINGCLYGRSSNADFTCKLGSYAKYEGGFIKININYTQTLEYNIKFTQLETSVAIDENKKIWALKGGYGTAYSEYDNGIQIIPSVLNQDFIQIDEGHRSGSDCVVALSDKGKVYAWGMNSYKFGGSRYVPIDITDKFTLEENTKIVNLSLEDDKLTAVDSLGKVWILSNNTSAECISDDIDEPLYDVKIIKVEEGYYCRVAIDDKGKVWFWGSTNYILSDELESFCNDTNNPICLSDIIGMKFYELYNKGTKFIDAVGSNYDILLLLDNNGCVWKITQDSMECLNDKEDSVIYNSKVVKIDIADYKHIYYMDSLGNAYIDDKKCDAVDIGQAGYIDSYGQVYNWQNENIFGKNIENPLYNKSVKHILCGKYAELDNPKGEIYKINELESYFVIYGPRYIEDYLGKELVATTDIMDGTFTPWYMAVDNDGKVWACGYECIDIFGYDVIPNNSVPVCVSDVENSQLYNAYKSNPEFKIVDIKLYYMQRYRRGYYYDNNISLVVLLDNNGKIWVCGEDSPISDNKTEFICISDIEGTELNQKYKTDPTYKIVNIQNDFGSNGKYMFTDSNNDTWVWGRNEYGSLGNGTTSKITMPYCISKSLGGAKISKILNYSSDEDQNSNITYIIDTEGCVWTCGGWSKSNPTYGFTQTYKTTPYKISEEMTGIKDIYLSTLNFCIAYGENTVWIWGDSKYWGNESAEKKYTPILLSTELSVKKVIDNSFTVLIDTQGKVWTIGHKRHCGYKTNNDYNPLTCISDDENEKLNGINVVDGKEIAWDSIIAGFYKTGIGKEDVLLIDDNNRMYDISNHTYETGEIDEYDNTEYIEKTGELRGKTIVEQDWLYTIDSNENLYYSYSNDTTICLTTVQNAKESAVNTNKILMNKPEKNELYGVKISDLITDKLLKDDENNYYYKIDNKFVNVSKQIANKENALYGKTIIDLIDGKYAITSENKIYDITGCEPVYMMNFPAGIEIEQIYTNFDIAMKSYNKFMGYYIILDKSGKIWTCGSGKYGQLGNGSVNDTNIPVCISNIEGTEFSKAYKQNENFKIESINCYPTDQGNQSIIALDNEGKIWTWGYNPYGELGNGTTKYTDVPVCISNIEGTELSNAYKDGNLKISKIQDTYDRSFVAIDNTGKVWVWGKNSNGEFGIGNSETIKSPICISNIQENLLSQLGENFKVIDAKLLYRTFILLGNDGKVYRSNSTGIECVDETMTEITNIYKGDNSAVFAYGENKIFKVVRGKPITNISTEFTPDKIIVIGYSTIFLDDEGKVWVNGKIINDGNFTYSYLGYPTNQEVTTPVCITNKSTLPIYQKQIVDIDICYLGSAKCIIARDSDDIIYEWGCYDEPMKICTRFDEATQTIYGDVTVDHKMQIAKLYSKYEACKRILCDNKIYEIMLPTVAENVKGGDIQNIVQIFNEKNSMKPIAEILGKYTIKTSDGRIYNIHQTSNYKDLITKIEDVPTNIDELPSTKPITLKLPSSTIVAQVGSTVLDDKGNVYMLNSNKQVICANEGEYIVEPIYSSGNGWTPIKQAY